MIERIIKALQTTGLNTREDFANIEEGDVLKLKFRNEKEFETLLGLHIFEVANEADLVEFQNGVIPIIEGSDRCTNIADVQIEKNVISSVSDLPPENPSITFVEKALENSVSSIQEKSVNIRSRCPQCGRVKAKNAEFCKNCVPVTTINN